MARDQDKYFGAPVGLGDPANEAVAVMPGDVLEDVSRGLYVGVGGDVALKLGDNDDFILFRNMAEGADYGYRVKEIGDSDEGTTASGLVALY